MRCEELSYLLTIFNRRAGRDILYQSIATHIRACSACARGLTQLAPSLLSHDRLSCEDCRARFPGYYEATHPDHPQVTLPDVAIAEVAIHLGHCHACHDQYEALRELAQIEELGL